MQTASYSKLNQIPDNPIYLTKHALDRMNSRRFSSEALDNILKYGRAVFIRGAAIHVIGKKEVRKFQEKGINLSAYEGIHVVCTPTDDSVLTVYKNKDFRGLRPKRRGRQYRRNYTN